ncbi:MAG: hypothetical protein JNG88_11480 [Phycisphaerales bacterium]|nr:hypothetical protein [Phycisphaerales bacterium]
MTLAADNLGFIPLIFTLALLAVGVAVMAIVPLTRRRLRSASAIERNLRAYASGIEKQLLALTLSDSLGETATAWNRIIAESVSLRQELELRNEIEKSGAILSRFSSGVFRRMLDRMPMGVVRVTRDLRIAYSNAISKTLLSLPSNQEANITLEAFIKDNAAREIIQQAIESGRSGSKDISIKEDGLQIDLRFHILPPAERGDDETIVVIEDLGAMRAMERARDDFLYHITHELRTPLTNIRAYVETLTKPEFDDEVTRKECFNVIMSETGRLSRLIEDVLSFSQMEVGTLRLEMGNVDLARLVRQLVQDNLGAADEKGVELKLRMPPKTPKLRGDKQRLATLINNLVGNAVKYTPSGGRVEISVEPAERDVSIVVKDTGIGISEEDQARVFEKFYRASSNTVQSITGTGLGLAIARDIACMHGGEITLASKLGEGSTFTLTLPLHADEPVEAKA